jgi:hypothetical protein
MVDKFKMAAKSYFLDIGHFSAKTAEILGYDSWTDFKNIFFRCFGKKSKMAKILQMVLESIYLVFRLHQLHQTDFQVQNSFRIFFQNSN